MEYNVGFDGGRLATGKAPLSIVAMPGDHKSPMILSAVSGTHFFASVLIIIAPSPNSIHVLTQSALLGRGAGLRATKGGRTGLLECTATASFGVAAIFQTSVLAFIAPAMTRSRTTADGLRLDVGAFDSGPGYISGTRAVLLGKPAQ